MKHFLNVCAHHMYIYVNLRGKLIAIANYSVKVPSASVRHAPRFHSARAFMKRPVTE